MAPVNFRPKASTVEIWRFLNLTADSHPVRIHGVLFQVLDKRPFDVARYKANGTIAYTGPARPPDPWDIGWKGVVRADPGLITRIIARFGPFTGRHVYHSTMLEHVDNDMKRPFEVV
jgi:spore coat protein A